MSQDSLDREKFRIRYAGGGPLSTHDTYSEAASIAAAIANEHPEDTVVVTRMSEVEIKRFGAGADGKSTGSG